MGHFSDSPVKPATDVYLLTDSRLVREALARMLQKRPDLCVAGASDFRSFDVEAVADSGCAVMLMDRLISPQDTDLVRELLQRAPAVKVVLFGMEDDSSTFIRAASLGVCGYLLKDASAAEIVGAVRTVSHDEAVCPPRLCMALIQHVARELCSGENVEAVELTEKPSLTYRQLELVDLVAKGKTNKEIAANLNLSEFTVRNHIRRIMKQLDADDRHHVVRMVRGNGVELHS